MKAKLVYELVMSLSDNERALLLDMLEPHLKKFDLDNFFSDEIDIGYSDTELTNYLIKNLFSKCKKILNS